MGRFDALTQIEEKPQQSAPTPVGSAPPLKKPLPQGEKRPVGKIKKPEIMKSRNHENSPPPESLDGKPLKYSTLIAAHLIKKIKLYAAERELKDYEVIERALTDYFKNHQ